MNRIIVYLVLAVTLLTLSFFGGCSYHKKKFKPSEPITMIVVKYDTVEKRIPSYVPWLIQGKDSIVYRTDTVPGIVDTLAILADYYAMHIRDNQWKDTSLVVDLQTFISQNQLMGSVFRYKILRPQQIITNIDNSKHYSKYITAGLSVPIKDISYTSFDANFIFKKGYIGVSYNHGLQNFGVNAGTVLFKFK